MRFCFDRARVGRLGPDDVLTDLDFLEREIARFKASKRRLEMLTAERYYEGRHDVLTRQRTGIGENGEPVPILNLPNNRIVDNQYRKMVVQKTNYLLGQPIVLRSEDGAYVRALQAVFDKRFMRLMKNVGRSAISEGICYLLAGYDGAGNLTFKRVPAHELIPGWRDAEHTQLDYAIRVYPLIAYEDGGERLVEKAEVYDEAGVHYFELDGGRLVPEPPYHAPHFTADGEALCWTRIPLVAFKRDAQETPLIRSVKSLQDGLNAILSNYQNNMEEDARNTILVLVNYDGENLGEFRRNLAQYGAIKVRTVDGAPGDLRTLRVEVNAENYRAILELFKKAIIENAMGYDAKDDRLSGNPNQMNIQSMYSDIDLDANEMETEFQAGMEELIWFVTCHLANTGAGDYEGTPVEVIFNRDMLISESEAIANIRASTGILSEETLVAQHPWVDDVPAEMARRRREAQEAAEDAYGAAFAPAPREDRA